MYSATDIINLKDCVKSLKDISDQICSLHHEFVACLCRYELFLDRYEDTVPFEQDDLPL